MKRESLEETCIGHITHYKKDCYECKEDNLNKNCENYVPMKIFYVENKR